MLCPQKKLYYLFNASFLFQISFAGRASANSILLVDSFRFISPSTNEELCDIYNDNQNEISTSTTVAQPEPTTQTTPTEDECITYNFENDVQELLTNNYDVCNGNALWSIGSYASSPINSPNPSSHTFISPTASYSCVTSFPFPVTSGGIIEVNIYLALVASSDRLTILVHQESNGRTVGNYIVAGSNTDSAGRWLTAHINVYGTGNFNAYVSTNAAKA